MPVSDLRTAYLFLDEGGNLDFSDNGSRYFTMSSVLTYRPFALDAELTELKFDLIEAGVDKEYFHATEDEQATRNRVFDLIEVRLKEFRVDSVIVEKRKAAPKVRTDARFYPDNLGYLLKYVMHPRNTSGWSNLIVITDRLPVNRKRRAIEKAIKTSLAAKLPTGVPYRIFHHDSKSCCGLQVADYFNWAIYRKWDRRDLRSYDRIKAAM